LPVADPYGVAAQAATAVKPLFSGCRRRIDSILFYIVEHESARRRDRRWGIFAADEDWEERWWRMRRYGKRDGVKLCSGFHRSSLWDKMPRDILEHHEIELPFLVSVGALAVLASVTFGQTDDGLAVSNAQDTREPLG